MSVRRSLVALVVVCTSPIAWAFQPAAEPPAKLRLADAATGSSRVFTFGESASGLIGYAYDAPNPLDREFIALRGDGMHIVSDANGNEVWFDSAKRFVKVRPLLVKLVQQGAYSAGGRDAPQEFVAAHTARLEYQFSNEGFRVVEARLFKAGLSTPVHALRYRYGDGSMLEEVATR